MIEERRHGDEPEPAAVKRAVIRERLFRVVSDAFPRYADIRRRAKDGDLRLLVTWLLRTDPTQPTKSSWPIDVYITRDAINQYASFAADHQASADELLRQRLAHNLKRFDLQNELPPPMLPPPVTWVVTAEFMRAVHREDTK